MSKLQITPGTATVRNRTEVYGAGGGYFIGSTCGHSPPTDQDADNATLFADAINTHNQCQTLPSELMAALEKIAQLSDKEPEDPGPTGNEDDARRYGADYGRWDCAKIARKTLSKLSQP